MEGIRAGQNNDYERVDPGQVRGARVVYGPMYSVNENTGEESRDGPPYALWSERRRALIWETMIFLKCDVMKALPAPKRQPVAEAQLRRWLEDRLKLTPETLKHDETRTACRAHFGELNVTYKAFDQGWKLVMKEQRKFRGRPKASR